jgi:hypothetical protein
MPATLICLIVSKSSSFFGLLDALDEPIRRADDLTSVVRRRPIGRDDGVRALNDAGGQFSRLYAMPSTNPLHQICGSGVMSPSFSLACKPEGGTSQILLERPADPEKQFLGFLHCPQSLPQ